MGAIGNTKITLASAVADGATVTVPYPTGTDQAGLTSSTGGVVSINDGAGGTFDQGAGGFTVSFGGADITITNDSDVQWPAGAVLLASFGLTATKGSYNAITNDVSWAEIKSKPSTFPPIIGTGADEAAAGDGSNPNYTAA